jgi:preprotein translocase subunit SecG
MSKSENDFESEEQAQKKKLSKTLAIIAVVFFVLSFAWHIVPLFFGAAQ